MTSAPLVIDAVVHSAERPVVAAAARQLNLAVAAATGSKFPLIFRFNASLDAIGAETARSIVVASFLAEIPGRDESLEQTEARWRSHMTLLVRADRSVLLCTIFRHVPNPGRPAVIERIRQLNLMATRLSKDTAVAVADIDRVFAHFGARSLKTDYLLGGAAAAALAGHTIVASILADGLDDILPPEIQERAKKVQDDLFERLSTEIMR